MAQRCSSGLTHDEISREGRRSGEPDFSGESSCAGKLEASSSESLLTGTLWAHKNQKKTQEAAKHMDKVFSLVRKMYGYSPNDEMEGINVNGATWSIFMSATLRAALTLGNNYTEILTTIKTEKSLRQLFHITQDLVLEQTETTGITTIDWLESDNSAQ